MFLLYPVSPFPPKTARKQIEVYEMYVWNIEFQEHWDNQPEGEFDSGAAEYIVAAKDYDGALAKAKKVALKKSYLDDADDGDGKRHYVTDVRLVSIKRGDELDA